MINQYLRGGLAILTLFAFFLNTIPIRAQGGDIVGSDDISGGSSVFVFRKSRNTAQSKFVARTSVKQTAAQKAKSRQSVRAQVAKAPPTRPKATKVDPNNVAQNTGKTNNNGKNTGTNGAKTAGPAETSVILAGAAETFLDKGDTQKAISYFREAVKLDPKNETAKQGLSEALTRYADSIYDQSGADSAKPVYEEAIQLNSKNAAAYAALGSIYDDQDNTDLAFQNYEQALKIDPNLTELYAPIGVAYYQKDNIAKAEEYLVKASNSQTEDEQTQFLLGVIRYKQQRYNEAAVALNKSLQIKDNAEAHYYLGEILDKQDRSNDAIAQYKQAVKLNPRYTEAWFDLGVAQYNHNNFDEAINAYKQAITLKNDNYEFYENLADVYRQIGFKDKNVRKINYQQAESYYNLAITFAERNKDKINETALADLYSKQGFVTGGLNKWEATINVLAKAVAISADSVDYTNLGWAYYNSAQDDIFSKREAQAKPKLEKARDALQKATAMDSRAVGAFMNLGVTLIDLGDAKGAIEALKTTVGLRDKWLPALNELGLAYYLDKNYDEAIKNFKKTVDIDKNFSSGLYNWSRAEFARGNLKEAKKVQDQLRKIDPNRANALEALFISSNPANQFKEKIEQKNPLRKLPRFPFN